jgi:hypothetical protein
MTTAYTDFSYYQTTYLGTSIASADFAQLALRASAVIDRITFNRATDETDVDVIDDIKMAVCAVAEELQTEDNEGGEDAIVNETTGSHSVTYANNAARRLTLLQKQTNAARLYLDNTDLLYAGFATGEYSGTLEE